MTELTDKLETVIQQAALDGALTKDAVSQFHSLVVERNALKDANEEWEENDKKLKKEVEKLVTDHVPEHSPEDRTSRANCGVPKCLERNSDGKGNEQKVGRNRKERRLCEGNPEQRPCAVAVVRPAEDPVVQTPDPRREFSEHFHVVRLSCVADKLS